VNLDDVEKMIAEAESGVHSIEKKLHQDIDLDPASQQAK
jgi:hypothetical protein